MKNYTLYFVVGNSKIPVFKGTLKEIDNLTTAFIDENKLGETLIYNYETSSYNSFELKSSKGNTYKVLYSDFAGAVTLVNSDLVKNYLINLGKERLLSFLEKNTKILEYLKNGKNLDKIPLYRLYNVVLYSDKDSILYEIDKFINEDYKNYRMLAIGILRENRELPFKKDKVNKEDLNFTIETIRYKSRVDYEDLKIENDCSYSNPDELENILNRSMDPDVKINEISFLIDDEDEFRNFIEKNKELLFGIENGKSNF